MPLEWNYVAVSRHRDRALYQQLADAIRAGIDSGELHPGEALPSEAEMAERVGLSKNAIREALAQLVQEGRIVKQAGFPTRVVTPEPIRHMATSRYLEEQAHVLRALLDGVPHPKTSAFMTDHGIRDWSDIGVRATYKEDTADEADADRLQIWVGAKVLRRDLLKFNDGRAVQVQCSTVPLTVAQGTPLMDETRQPWPGGTMWELASSGLWVSAVIEEAQTRNPTPAERELLSGPAGPVFDIVRIFVGYPIPKQGEPSAAERPLEASAVVVPGAGVKLRFETRLPGWPE